MPRFSKWKAAHNAKNTITPLKEQLKNARALKPNTARRDELLKEAKADLKAELARPPRNAPKAASAMASIINTAVKQSRVNKLEKQLGMNSTTAKDPVVSAQHASLGVERKDNPYQVMQSTPTLTGAVGSSTGVQLTTANINRTRGDMQTRRGVRRSYVSSNGEHKSATWTVFKHTEYVRDVVATGTAYNPVQINVNPGNPFVVPMLAQEAILFEEYVIESDEWEFRTQTPVSSGGRFGLAIDYNVSDPPPATKQIMYDTGGAVAGPIYQNLKIHMRRVPANYLNAYFVGAVPSGADPKFYSPYTLNYFTQDSAVTGTIGELFRTYEVWCRETTLDNASGSLTGQVVNMFYPNVSRSNVAIGQWATDLSLVPGAAPLVQITYAAPQGFDINFPNLTRSYLVYMAVAKTTPDVLITPNTSGYTGASIMLHRHGVATQTYSTASTSATTANRSANNTGLPIATIFASATMRIDVVAGIVSGAQPFIRMTMSANPNTDCTYTANADGPAPSCLCIVQLPPALTNFETYTALELAKRKDEKHTHPPGPDVKDSKDGGATARQAVGTNNSAATTADAPVVVCRCGSIAHGQLMLCLTCARKAGALSLSQG